MTVPMSIVLVILMFRDVDPGKGFDLGTKKQEIKRVGGRGIRRGYKRSVRREK